MYKLISCVSLAMLMHFASNSQAIINAYIISLQGDSIKGQVQLPGDNVFGKNVYARLGGGIKFRQSGGSFKDYSPNEIKEFGYYTGDSSEPVKRYCAEKVYKRTRLLIIKIDGPLRLYKDVVLRNIGYNTVNVDYLFIKKSNSPLLEVEDIYYDKEKYKKPLKKYLAGCSSLDQVFNQKNLDPEKLVRSYNEICK